MAYTRQYGQAQQGASPWSSGAPPGLQQQSQQAQPMFNQPMGGFDVSGAWQGQPQVAQQWMGPAMQQVQLVPAFMQQPQMRMQQQSQGRTQQQPRVRMQQHQRPQNHQRSLSAPRVGGGGQKRPMNQNNNGGQQVSQRLGRQQPRTNGNNHQRGQSGNNTNNSNQNNNNNVKQPQQQHHQQQQNAKQAVRKGTKVTKTKKVVALKAKQNGKLADGSKVQKEPKKDEAISKDDTDQAAKPLSKTAERRQMKLQARKNAEALDQSQIPVSKSVKDTNETGADTETKADEPIDQAQLRCVPAVFGFVCKCCDLFLRDKNSRRQHIDSDDHMQKFKIFEEKRQAEASIKIEEEKPETPKPETPKVETPKEEEQQQPNLDDVSKGDEQSADAAMGDEAEQEP